MPSFNHFSANPIKWKKHIQIICRLLPTNYLSVFDYFVRVARKGLTNSKTQATEKGFFYYFIFKLGFTPRKAQQLQEKEAQKD